MQSSDIPLPQRFARSTCWQHGLRWFTLVGDVFECTVEACESNVPAETVMMHRAQRDEESAE